MALSCTGGWWKVCRLLQLSFTYHHQPACPGSGFGSLEVEGEGGGHQAESPGGRRGTRGRHGPTDPGGAAAEECCGWLGLHRSRSLGSVTRPEMQKFDHS